MSIIPIARASYSHGRMIVEKVAKELNYQCNSEDIIILASREFGIPENWLRRAVEKALSFLDRFGYGKKRYVAYISSALSGICGKREPGLSWTCGTLFA